MTISSFGVERSTIKDNYSNMVKTRKVAKQNDRLLSLCRSVTVRLTREIFSSYERLEGKRNQEKTTSSVLEATVSMNLRSRYNNKKLNGE